MKVHILIYLWLLSTLKTEAKEENFDDNESKSHKLGQVATNIAQKAAQDAKAAEDAMQQAGQQAARQVKTQLAEKAVEASKAAEAALSGIQKTRDTNCSPKNLELRIDFLGSKYINSPCPQLTTPPPPYPCKSPQTTPPLCVTQLPCPTTTTEPCTTSCPACSCDCEARIAEALCKRSKHVHAMHNVPHPFTTPSFLDKNSSINTLCIAGKEEMVAKLQEQLKEAETVVNEESANLQQLQLTVQAATKAAQQAQTELKLLQTTLQLAQGKFVT